MQTQAEQQLIRHLSGIVRNLIDQGNTLPRLLNIGAGRSLVIENALAGQGLTFTADRIDVEDCKVVHPCAGNAHTSSVESMPMLGNGVYDAAYANFVFEHVADPAAAAAEIHRILALSGMLVVSIPNPQAPEFALVRHTALWFRRMIRGKQAWATHYRYKNIEGFCETFKTAGFELISLTRLPALHTYLNPYPVAGMLAKCYDGCLVRIKADPLLGHACIVLKK